MIPLKGNCSCCGAELEVNSYRKFVKCPYCGTELAFDGFEYQTIDWRASMYAAVKLWTDCPVCRSPNMYLGPEKQAWRCPDCGYIWPEKERKHGVLWFCDDCETYLNIQPGFTTKNKTWKCTECGHINSVTKKDIY